VGDFPKKSHGSKILLVVENLNCRSISGMNFHLFAAGKLVRAVR